MSTRVSLYAPNGRAVGSIFYHAKQVWFERLAAWLRDPCAPDQALVLGGDFNVAPAFTWWDYRAGHFSKSFGMRIDHLLVTSPLAGRVLWPRAGSGRMNGLPAT